MCAGAKGKPELVHISTGLWRAEEGGSDFRSAMLLTITNEMGSSQIFQKDLKEIFQISL